MKVLVPEDELYLEGSMCEGGIHVHYANSFLKIRKNQCKTFLKNLKIENMVLYIHVPLGYI